MPNDGKRTEKADTAKPLDRLTEDEIIELSGGKREFNEKFYRIFGSLKKS